jgi:UDP-N-acetylmuramate: L-alanyl-gamma-D-glutamyl-meso-diaminopimelate ligase
MAKSKLKIHILAIAGAMTHALALELKRQGHQVSGCDQDKIYPPFSTNLQNAGIPINQTPIDSSLDLIIVGAAYKNIPRATQEFIQVQEQHLPYISATQYLAKHLAQDNSILIAGSYGKTTITALITQILIQAKFQPSYFIGSQLIDPIPSLHFDTSSWSVLEADESINGLDCQAKFLYYPVKHAIITSVNWEHRDSYSSFEQNLDAYRQLILRIPADGILVYNPRDLDLVQLISQCRGKAVPYDFSLNPTSQLLGDYNRDNSLAAATLAKLLDIDQITINTAIANFKGVKRRLEKLAAIKDIIFYDDFAQAPNRVESALKAILQRYPHHRLKVFFEPHASFLQTPLALTDFPQAFSSVSEIVLARIPFKKEVNKASRVTAKTYQDLLGSKLRYLPLYDEIEKHYQTTLQPGDILIHFSSGGLDGQTTLEHLIKHYQDSC